MLRRCVTCLTFSLVGALACAAALPPAARAADIYPGEAYPDRYGRYERYERYEPYPRETYGAPVLRPPAPVLGEADGYCRIRHRRALDEYGREVVRRERVCDEGVVAQRLHDEPRPRYGVAPPRRWSPPARPLDPGYDDDDD